MFVVEQTSLFSFLIHYFYVSFWSNCYDGFSKLSTNLPIEENTIEMLFPKSHTETTEKDLTNIIYWLPDEFDYYYYYCLLLLLINNFYPDTQLDHQACSSWVAGHSEEPWELKVSRKYMNCQYRWLSNSFYYKNGIFYTACKQFVIQVKTDASLQSLSPVTQSHSKNRQSEVKQSWYCCTVL